MGVSPLALAADPLPTGGQVAAGEVSIGTSSPTRMVVDQRSDRAVVNWDSFSIGRDAHVDFRQPSRSSAILNRVTGSADSRIHGRLTANGQVHIVNPNGIFIGPDGRISAGGGFVGSSLAIRDDDFMAGRLRYEGTGASAPVRNGGTIEIGRGGYAALLGGRVGNSGTVSVPLGRIGFASGERVTLDLSGDGFLQVALPSEVAGDDALVDNSGTASAEGGRIEMKAAAARNAARHAVNLSGVAEARSVGVRNGAIVLGGSGGSVRVGGTVSTRRAAPAPRPTVEVARSPRPVGRPGGDITVTGTEIALEGATIDASGAGGGGRVRIGGDFAGAGPLQRAETLDADAATRISADALGAGDGGRIVLWSDGRTDVAARFTARGAGDGTGGFVEVSSARDLTYRGLVDLRSDRGTWGTLLLDPVNVTIPGTVDIPTLQANLEGAGVTVDTTNTGTDAGNITLAGAVTWSAPTTLTLLADNDITITDNGSVTAAAGGLVLDAAADILHVGIIDVAQLSIAGQSFLQSGGITTETGSGGTVAVDTFELAFGSWTQAGPALSTFAATDFRLQDGADFVRLAGGDGSAGSPGVVTDVYGLQGLKSPSLLGGSFVLGNDIDAGGTSGWWDSGEGIEGFEPVGSSDAPFGGTLDGQGFDIAGLFIDRGVDAGLFDVLDDASVSNLSLTGVDITGHGTVGGLAATSNGSTLTDVSIAGDLTVRFAGSAGGLVGNMSGGSVTRGAASGTVSSLGAASLSRNLGGLVGLNDGGAVTDSSFDGTLTESGDVFEDSVESVTRDVGGLVGENRGTISGSTSSGTLSVTGAGETYAGGLAGRNERADDGSGISVGQSSSAMTLDIAPTNGDGAVAGGLIGLNLSAVTASVATGDVTVGGGGGATAGGLVGTNGSAITDSVASGAVSYSGGDFDIPGDSVLQLGGFAGSNAGQIARTAARGDVTAAAGFLAVSAGGHTGFNDGGTIGDSYATGAVTASSDTQQDVGGFVGLTQGGTLASVFAAGAVSATGGGSTDAGGLAGENIAVGEGGGRTDVTNGWFDSDTTGQPDPDDPLLGTPLTTAELQDTAQPLGFDTAATWAPGDTGFYPALYAVDRVLYALPDDVTVQYGLTGSATTTGTVRGGPASYVFAPAGDSLDTGSVFADLVFPTQTVGTGTFTLGTTSVVSTAGETYRVVDAPGAYEITPAPLTVTL
ncbi:hypothetical protein RISW2_11120, partial [Roseivivax isoporae LMG 25204]